MCLYSAPGNIPTLIYLSSTFQLISNEKLSNFIITYVNIITFGVDFLVF